MCTPTGDRYGLLLISTYCSLLTDGCLLQRVISKESFVGHSWNWAPLWFGPLESRIPLEAGVHRLFPRTPHIIEYLGFHVNKQLRMARHYTAFADLGDLESLYDNHKRRLKAVDEHGIALTSPSIPVVAIIYVFQAMAAGACLMAHGAVPDDQGSGPAISLPLALTTSFIGISSHATTSSPRPRALCYGLNFPSLHWATSATRLTQSL